MKRFIFAALLVIFLLPVSAFALVNAEVYGGYSFAGEISEIDAESVQGFGYGFRAHFYNEFIIFGYGIGGFAQYSPLEGELKISGDMEPVDFNKTTYGLDGFLTLNVPLLPIHPYMRGGVSIYEKTDVIVDKNSEENSEMFKSYYGGFGLSLGVLPLPVLSVQIFAEYLYEYSALEDDAKFTGHKVHLGALVRLEKRRRMV